MKHADPASSNDLVVAMTGASGAPYAVRLLQVVGRVGRTIHLCISPSAAQVLHEEVGLNVVIDRFDPAVFGGLGPGRLIYHHYQDFTAGIASGSFPTGGMIIIPCSMSTLGAIAGGMTTNLITRAADVHLKERRQVNRRPAQTPLSLIHLENMVKVTRAGAVVLPAMPGWYHQPRRLHDLIDFLVARICDQLDIPTSLMTPWGNETRSDLLDETIWDSGTSLDETHVAPPEGA